MRKIYDAIKFAEKHHRGQTRKVSGAPYITHPIAVSYLLVRYKVSKHLKDLIVACILHDVMEDTGVSQATISKKFGPLVASLCFELCNDQAQIGVGQYGKLEYQRRKLIGISSYGLVCKLVDRLDNILDNPTKKMVTDTLLLMGHLRKGRKLSKTQQRIVADIEAACRERLPADAELALPDAVRPKGAR